MLLKGEDTQNIEGIILQAAIEEFEKKGFEGARMQNIADKASINKALLHYYFRSKNALFERVFELAINEYIPVLNTLSTGNLPWEDKIRVFVSSLIKFIRGGKMLFIIREINRNPEIVTKYINGRKKPKLVLFFDDLKTQKQIDVFDSKLLYLFLNSLCCFPVLNQVMFQKSLKLSNEEFKSLLDDYENLVAKFFIQAIQKEVYAL